MNSTISLRKSETALSMGCISEFKLPKLGGYTLNIMPSQLIAFARHHGEPEYHNTDDHRIFGYQTSAMLYYEFSYNEWVEDQEWIASQSVYYSDHDENEDEVI